MFARFLEMSIKPEKKPDLMKVLKEGVLPMIKKCKGFFEMIPLEAEAEPTKFYLMSLWHEKRDAEQFQREHFPKIQAMYEPFLTAPIIVKLCRVDETLTTKKFLATAA